MIDWFKLGLQLLPVCLRKDIIGKLLAAFTTQLQSLYSTYLSEKESQYYTITHTGQVARLEQTLNEYFGLEAEDGFTITDNELAEYVYAYSEDSALVDDTATAVGEDSGLTPTYVFDEKSIGTEVYPYTLNIPTAIYSDSGKMTQVKKIVMTYRLPGRRCEYHEKQ